MGSHSRKVVEGLGNGGLPRFTPTIAIALEAQAPQTVASIPARAFCQPIAGERGVLYIAGGLHSNYQGNEIDRMSLPVSTDMVVTTEISHQPNRPPEGPYSGYGGGQGGYIHRLYSGGLADNSHWQPFPGHQWTQSGWHPDWGFFQQGTHPLQASYPDGAYQTSGGVLLTSKAQPSDIAGSVSREDHGIIGFNWSTRKYKTYYTTGGLQYPQTIFAKSGVSDWNNWDQSILFLETNAGITYFRLYRLGGGYGFVDLKSTRVIGGFDANGGNGLLVRVLEHRKYLILRASGSGSFATRTKLMIYSEDFGADDARFKTLAIPSYATTGCMDDDDCLTFTVDKNSRRVFWMVFPGKGVPCRFYYSHFDSIETWVPLTLGGTVVIPADQPAGEAWIAASKQPMHFRDGYLYLAVGTPGPSDPGYTNGAMNWWRVKVDDGESLPPMNFQRYDYRVQNFVFSSASYLQLWGNKHANWSYRSPTGEHIVCAGDLGNVYNTSMATLVFDSAAPGGYRFTEILNETSPAPIDPATGQRMKRPASTDDGGWFYSSSNCPDASLRDRFVHARGGDGLGYNSNPLTGNAYRLSVPAGIKRDQWDARVDVAEGVAAMQADGWTIERLLVYDPVKKGFYSTGMANWTLDAGGVPLTHPALIGSSQSRCAAYDETTGCVFRFTNYTGSIFLLRYDLTRKTIKAWNCSAWWDTAGLFGPAGRRWYTDSQMPTSQTVEKEFGWYDTDAGRWHTSAANHWEHKALWLDESNGKLYVVSPVTGFLWCYETRGAETVFGGTGFDGVTIPFYPVGERIPLSGCYPAMKSQRQWPPVRWDQPGAQGNADCAMNSYLVPFKGGLLWWGGNHHDQGAFGHPRYCFWRRLGYNGAWTVVTTPQEFAANSYSVVSRSINNTEVVLLAGGGNNIETQGPWPFFWRLN